MAKPPKQTKKTKPVDPLLVRAREGSALMMPALNPLRNSQAYPEAGTVAGAVKRLERIEAQIRDLNDAKSRVYRELRGQGFDAAAVRHALKERRLAPEVRQERDEIRRVYWAQLEAALDAVEAKDAAE